MCKYCEEDGILDVAWLDEDDEADCEWLPDEDEEEDLTDEDIDADDLLEGGFPTCIDPAVVIVQFKNVDAHLCLVHLQTVKADLEEGLGALLAATGLGDEIEFLPLDENSDETCDECSERATYAQIVTCFQTFCAEHAVAFGATLPPKP